MMGQKIKRIKYIPRRFIKTTSKEAKRAYFMVKGGKKESCDDPSSIYAIFVWPPNDLP
jgi:hypothetical protein